MESLVPFSQSIAFPDSTSTKFKKIVKKRVHRMNYSITSIKEHRFKRTPGHRNTITCPRLRSSLIDSKFKRTPECKKRKSCLWRCSYIQDKPYLVFQTEISQFSTRVEVKNFGRGGDADKLKRKKQVSPRRNAKE